MVCQLKEWSGGRVLAHMLREPHSWDLIWYVSRTNNFTVVLSYNSTTGVGATTGTTLHVLHTNSGYSIRAPISVFRKFIFTKFIQNSLEYL